jgi:glycosyltransferase involved in cell wall biosynthesis
MAALPAHASRWHYCVAVQAPAHIRQIESEVLIVLSRRVTSPVRILHIVGESRFGGAGKVILGLGHTAQAEGWQVDILTTDPVFQQAVTQHGLGLVNLDVIRREIRPLWDLGGLVRLHRFLRREAYDLVHTHTSKGGFVGRLAARLAGVPVIVHTAHGFAFHEGTPAPTRRFYSTLERIASRWCDRIVSVSEFHRSWAIELGMCSPYRIIAIPNGIAVPGRNPVVKLVELRRQLGARHDDLLILSISRLAPDKGLKYLIEAAAILPPMGRRVQIVIAGDGPAQNPLEQLAANLGVTDRVAFIGFREDIGDLLAACDLVVLPSLREGLSIALLEAMAAGKPIIATSIGSQREVSSHADMALLVRPADAPSLSESILRLVADRALMARLGNNARTVYENFYTENRMLQSYRKLYLDLLDAKRPKRVAIDSRNHSALLGGRHEELSQVYSKLVSSPEQLKGDGQ